MIHHILLLLSIFFYFFYKAYNKYLPWNLCKLKVYMNSKFPIDFFDPWFSPVSNAVCLFILTKQTFALFGSIMKRPQNSYFKFKTNLILFFPSFLRKLHKEPWKTRLLLLWICTSTFVTNGTKTNKQKKTLFSYYVYGYKNKHLPFILKLPRALLFCRGPCESCGVSLAHIYSKHKHAKRDKP